MERTLAIIMAGGVGERLFPLTKDRAKAAVPFGGKFRLIDFTLSNCVNSGIRQIFVLTQYRLESLHRHIQDGWGISSAGLGDFIYSVPAQQKGGADWYSGTADAVRQNLNLIKQRDFDRVLVLSGDHVYKMDYRQMVDFHRAKQAGVTIAAVRARKEEAAGRLGVLQIDHNRRVIGFQEKPKEPKTMPDAPEYALASMGVYLFEAGELRESLQGTEDDFGKHVIPRMAAAGEPLFVYDYEKLNRIEDFVVEVRDGRRQRALVSRTRDSAYWRDVGTIESFYEAGMDLVGVDPLFNLYGERWLIRTYQRPMPPTKCVIGGRIEESLVSDGVIISGGVVRESILSPGVIVEKDAYIERSIVFDDAIIEPRVAVRRAIIDKEVRIRSGATIGYDLDKDRKKGCTVSESGIVVVPRGLEIAA